MGISKFANDPTTTPTIRSELDSAKKILEDVERFSPEATRYYVLGNHELRLRRYLIQKAPEIIELVCFEDLVNTHGKFEVIGKSTKENYVKIGELYVGHWDRVSKFSAYTVKNIIADRGVSIVQSHTHRLGYYVATNFDRTVEGWEIGCLCNLNPAYVVNPNWQLGFGVIEPMNGGKDYSFTLVHIKRADNFYYFRYGSKQFKVEVAK